MREHAQVNPLVLAPVEPYVGPVFIRIVVGVVARDRIRGWRRLIERVYAGSIRGRRGWCHDPIHIDEGHGRTGDDRQRSSTGIDDPGDLNCGAGGHGDEGREAKGEYEEDREHADCPVSAQMHSGFSSLALSRPSLLDATRSKDRRMRRIE